MKDKLIPLLAKDKANDFGFRQGVLLSWDSDTAANTVQVGGTVMTNLPVMGATEAATLETGDVVVVFTGGPTWMIAGKLLIPGTSEAEARLSSLTIQTNSVTGLDSFTSTSYTAATTNPGPTVSIYVPKSGNILVFLTAHISGQSSLAAGNTMISGGSMGFTLSGANTLAASTTNGVMVSGNVTITSSAGTHGSTGDTTKIVALSGLNPGLTTVTAMYARVGNGTQTNFTDRNITVFAI